MTAGAQSPLPPPSRKIQTLELFAGVPPPAPAQEDIENYRSPTSRTRRFRGIAREGCEDPAAESRAEMPAT